MASTANLTAVAPVTELAPVESMTERELLAELVTNVRELRAVLDPIIENPAALLANMGPMAGIFAGILGGGKRG